MPHKLPSSPVKEIENCSLPFSSPQSSPIVQFLRRIRNRSKSPSADKMDGKLNGTTTTTSKSKLQKHDEKMNSTVLAGSNSMNTISTPKGSRNPFGGLIARLSSRRPRRTLLKSTGENVTNGRIAISEEDLVSKSLVTEIEKGESPLAMTISPDVSTTENSLTAYYSQESVFDSPDRLPSYVRVSCALSGYRQFARSHNRYGIQPQSGDAWKSPLGRSLVERRLDKFETFQPSSTSSTQSPQSCLDPHQSEDDESTTPVRQLIANFDLLRLINTSERSPHQRPRNRPPPPPFNKLGIELSPIESEEHGGLTSSSATTASCITGPLTTSTQDGSSLLDDVLKACDSTMETKNGQYYLKEAMTRRRNLEERCEQGQKELDSQKLPEHAADALRLAIGKTGLLLRKKVSKFDELVQKHLNPIPNDPMSATVDDLEGYWALIQMDMEDIGKCFDKVEKMRRNNWQPIVDDDQPKSNGTSNRPKNLPNAMTRSIYKSNVKSPTNESSTAKAEERKNMLAEAKWKAKQRMKQSGSNDEIQIFQ